VVVYDHFKKDTLKRLGYDKHEHVQLVTGDILDVPLLRKSMEGADIVIHTAAIVGVYEVNDQLATMQTNIIGTYNVLEAARLCGVKDRVIIFSTSEIFGKMAYHVKETDNVESGPPGEARWGYGISKIAGEHFSNAYHKQFGLPTVNVRPFNIYGPGQTMNGAMKMFIWKALQNENIQINGDGSPIRAWCYIDDFVDCIIRCIEHPKAIGESFNVGNSKTAITVYGLARMVCTLLGSRSKIIHGTPLPMEIYLRVPCVDKAKEILGFEATITLEEGIMLTAESVKKEQIGTGK
jgi:UDP-glucose 4-epimerase